MPWLDRMRREQVVASNGKRERMNRQNAKNAKDGIGRNRAPKNLGVRWRLGGCFSPVHRHGFLALM